MSNFEIFTKDGFVDRLCYSLKPYSSRKKGEAQFKWEVVQLERLGGAAQGHKLFTTEDAARQYLSELGYH